MMIDKWWWSNIVKVAKVVSSAWSCFSLRLHPDVYLSLRNSLEGIPLYVSWSKGWHICWLWCWFVFNPSSPSITAHICCPISHVITCSYECFQMFSHLSHISLHFFTCMYFHMFYMCLGSTSATRATIQKWLGYSLSWAMPFFTQA